MTNNNILQQLKERMLIAQLTNEQKLYKHLFENKIFLYCGFDPTFDSLHLGHLIPLICLKHFQLLGHCPIILIGGATGLIGDPSFKKNKRSINNLDTIQEWSDKIKKQISLFLDFNCGKNSAIITNNYKWFSTMNILTFLKKIGQHCSVNKMINKEAIKQRLYKNNTGLSYTELSYNILQGYDFCYLNKKYNVTLQIGGSDQWGNITSGINLTKRLNNKLVYGMTVPLLINNKGIKFGKTESNNNQIWLDSKKTSPYKFYQFWINIEDNDVCKFLKIFTFLDLSFINEICQLKKTISNIYKMKNILAEEVTRLVHGQKGLSSAKQITNNLFNLSVFDLKEKDFIQLSIDGINTIEINKKNIFLYEILVVSNLSTSNSQARTMIQSSSIFINGKKITSPKYLLLKEDKIFKKFTLIRRGKKIFCLVIWK